MSAPKSIDEVKNAVREVREVERVLLSSGARGGTPFEKALRKAVESKQARRAGDEYDKLASLREYQPGDDIRRIDHKASGRRGKLLVAQYHDSDESLKTDKAAFILDLDYLGMDPEQMNKFPTRLKHFLGLLYVAQRSHPTELYVTFKGEMIHHLSEEKLSSMLHSDSGDEALVGQLWEYRDRIAAQYQHKGRERIVALPGGVIDHELSKRGFEDASVVAAIHPKNLEQGMVALENYKRNHGCQITYL